MLSLPSVTFVMVETLSHQLARLAMEQCLSQIEFGDVLLLTDKLEPFQGLDTGTNGHRKPVHIRTHLVPNWPTKLDWCRANWFTVPPLIRTSHIMFCQWDAGLWNVNDWDDRYLDYDFIGALWQWHPAKRVGNTGFCLKSTRLARYIYDRPGQFPCTEVVEDDLLCRKYRPDLEDRGFTWAPESLAHRFAYEGCGPDPRPVLSSHFGFHGAFNFARVFDKEQLKIRADLMIKNDYVQSMMLPYPLSDQQAYTAESINWLNNPEVQPNQTGEDNA